MRKPLYIYGAGGFGREVLSMVRALEQWEVKGFLDDGIERGNIVHGIDIIGGMPEVEKLPENSALVFAIGNPLVKKKLFDQINTTIHFPVLIHPSAIIQDVASVLIGPGSIIAAGTILTTNITIGSHVLLNLNVTVGHDTSIGSYASIMPGVNIAGEVTIGDGVLLGSGSNIMNRVSIGDYAKVGMGAVVLRDVESRATVVGVPARPVKMQE
jgi:sugar O-acyltransferase (sialic acid O-acetyltransferase NeuD family)